MAKTRSNQPIGKHYETKKDFSIDYTISENALDILLDKLPYNFFNNYVVLSLKIEMDERIVDIIGDNFILNYQGICLTKWQTYWGDIPALTFQKIDDSISIVAYVGHRGSSPNNSLVAIAVRGSDGFNVQGLSNLLVIAKELGYLKISFDVI